MNDILITNEGEIKIENGDFVVDNSTLQHQALILITNPGEFKESPMLGVGIENYILDSDMIGCEFEAQLQFTMDGMKVKNLNFKNDIIIEADYL